jgi:hypothetical protein
LATPPKPVSEKIAAILDGADDYLTVDEICKAAFGRVGDRERGNVHLNLHRMGERGEIEKRAAGYRKKKTKAKGR